MDATKIRFVTSCYGDAYLGFLLVTIFSIRQSNPDARVTVVWEEIEERKIKILGDAFPEIEFVKVDFDVSKDIITRISSKTKLWEYALRRYQDERICLFDCDMLVLKDISYFFDNDFEIAFTYKDEHFPLNTGVMLVKNSVKTIPFFSKWREQTTNILENTRDFAKANSNKYPYGGADQMSFYNIINYQRNRTVFETIVNNEKILLKAVPCEMLNETRSTKITDKTHVIHYKGGWRQILLNGSGFTKNRQKKKSFEMYKVFLQTYLEAIDFLKNFDSDVEVADFGIKIHPYLNTTNWRENKKKYFFFAVKQNILFYIKKIVKLFSLIRKDEN